MVAAGGAQSGAWVPALSIEDPNEHLANELQLPHAPQKSRKHNGDSARLKFVLNIHDIFFLSLPSSVVFSCILFILDCETILVIFTFFFLLCFE